MVDAMDEQELICKFDYMVKKECEGNEPTRMFEGWRDEDKIKYMKQLEISLPEHQEATNLDDMDVPDSVLFDVTNDEEAQGNYISSIGHYRSWQYAGSDKKFEFGSKGRRVFVTRSTGVFMFYYRYRHLIVGLIIDGQRGWVEGAITSNHPDSPQSVLQFGRQHRGLDYIRSLRTHTLKYDGNYTGAGMTCEVKLGIWPVRSAVEAIGSYVPRVNKSEPDPIHWQILILFAAEAGRLNHVFFHTSKSLSLENGALVVLKLPPDGEQFIQNYLKLSLAAIAKIEGRAFTHVKGTTPRNLYQVLLEIKILRRKNLLATHFILQDAPPVEYKKDEAHRGKGGKPLTSNQKLEAKNSRGTRYLIGKDDGTAIYLCEEWLVDPFKEIIMSVQHGLANENWNLNDKKNLLVGVAEIQPGDARSVTSNILVPQEHPGLHKLNSTERLVVDQWYWEGQHQKKDQSAIGVSCFAMPKSGLAARTAHALMQEELHYDEPRRLPVPVGTDDREVPKIMKRSGSVWDGLRNPAVEDHASARATDNICAQNRVHKKAKLMVAEHEQRCCVNSSIEGDLFDKSSGPHANLEKDADSRNVVAKNVHLAATKEASSIHFMKCGTVLDINTLTDAITTHPKGAAYVTFADKESIDRATSLAGTSFFSSVLRVMLKAGAPVPGFLHPSLKGAESKAVKRKRELEDSPASCPSN